MALLWLILSVFLVSVEAENLTEVKGGLGRPVTLNCPLNTSDIYWYMEIHSQVRACIGRTFGRDPSSTQCYVTTSKYVLMGSRLVITNITAEDFRLYFCATKLNKNFNFKNTVRLVSDVPDTLSTNNRQQQQNQLVIYVICSSVLNAFLISAVIGLTFTSLCLKRKNCNYKVNDPSPFTCENPETLETRQYEEIQLPPSRAPPPAAPPPECIYYKAQLPRSTLL